VFAAILSYGAASFRDGFRYGISATCIEACGIG
jgi:hypothetical protein